MNKKELDARNPVDAAYAEAMAKALPKMPPIIRPVSKAQALHDNRHKDPDAYKAYLNRPEITYEDCKGTTVREMEIDYKQVMILESIRKSSKNTLGDFKESGLSSVSEEKKEIAISAFTCSPPAEITETEKALINTIAPYTELPPLPLEPPKKTIGDHISDFFKPKKREMRKDTIGYHLYRRLGGKDEDWK